MGAPLPLAVLRQQPQQAPQIDWSNPLTRGLAIAISGAHPEVNLANSRPVVALNGAQRRPGVAGLGVTFASTSTAGIQVAATSLLPGSAGDFKGGVTVLVLANPAASTTRFLPFVTSQAAQPEWYLQFNANKSLTATSGMFSVQTQGANGATFAGAVDGKTHLFAVVFPDGDTTPKLYLDGVDGTTSATPSTNGILAASNAQDYVGGYKSSGYATTGFSQFLTLAFNRALTPSEVRSLSDNPWQLFKAPSNLALIAAAAGTSALVVGAAFAGSAAAVAQANGNLTTAIRLAASAVASVSTSASLTTQITLSGAATAQAVGQASLTTQIKLAGAATGIASTSGALTTQISLSGSAQATASASATLSTGSGITGSAGAQATATAVLTTAIPLSGSAAAQATASATLTTGSGLTGSATGQASASASLTTSIALAGAAIAQAQASASLAGQSAALSGSAAGRATASAQLTTGIFLSGAAQATASGQAALSTQIALVAIAQAQASAAAQFAPTHAPTMRIFAVNAESRSQSINAQSRSYTVDAQLRTNTT